MDRFRTLRTTSVGPSRSCPAPSPGECARVAVRPHGGIWQADQWQSCAAILAGVMSAIENVQTSDTPPVPE